MTNKPTNEEQDDQRQRQREREQREESRNLKDSPIVTRDQLKAEEKPAKPGETVDMTTPAGTKVTVSAEAAETLRDAGYT
jgi:hypothetical protein